MLSKAGKWLQLLAVLIAGLLVAAASASASISNESVAYQLDPAHDGWLSGVSLTPPLTQAWADTFAGPPSYPLVVSGTVYVTGVAPGASNAALFALRQTDGAILWQHGLSAGSAGLAYDGGRVFVVDGNGLLSAFDAATGAIDWSSQLPGQYVFNSAPTAAGGIVYVGGSGSGGTLYAVSEATGALVWSQPVENGDTSSPALDGQNVYVTYPGQYYAFNLATGAPVWHDDEGTEGGGGWTPVVADGHLFARDAITSPKILSSASGALQGPLSATAAPAVAGGTAYELNGSTLEAVPDDGLGAVAWSFAGDGQLDTAPLVIGSIVWVGSSTGNLYAVSAATGQQVWSTNVGGAIDAPNEYNGPLRGMGAGGNSLLVPAGDSLIDYAGPAPATPPASAGPPPASTTPTSPATGTAHANPKVVAELARLAREIAPRLARRRLLARGRITLHIDAPSAGRFALAWFYVPNAHAKKLPVIAAGKLRFKKAGTRPLTLRLAARGARLLRRARRGATLLAVAAFVPGHGAKLAVEKRFRLTG